MEKMFGEDAGFYEERGCIHTATEIMQQPEMWKQMAADMVSRSEEITAFMERVMAVKDLRIIMTGAGSSAFVGETMQYMLANEMKLRTENVHTTDIISAPDATLFDVPTLLISYARSGESPESLAACQFAEKRIKELYQVVIVCDKNSTLAKNGYESEHALVLDMPPQTCDKAFAMTSSVSCMSLATWCLFHFKELKTYQGYVGVLAEAMAKQIGQLAEASKQIAEVDYRRLIWLGTGALKGLAREASIKSMELSDGYVFAGYDAPTGFRHGPKTVINDQTMTVHFLSNLEYSQKYDIDFIKEMVAEKQENVVVSVKAEQFANCTDGEDFEVVYQLPAALPAGSEMGAYINALVFSQLLSMFKSLQLGYKTDSPSIKGDVNRVVQGIVIYDIV